MEEPAEDDVLTAEISCIGWVASSQQWAQENCRRARGMVANFQYGWRSVDRELNTARDRNTVWRSGKNLERIESKLQRGMKAE